MNVKTKLNGAGLQNSFCCFIFLWLTAGCSVTAPVSTSPQGAPLASDAPAESVQVWVTTSNQKKLLAREADIAFGTVVPDSTLIEIDSDTRYQEMVGFGAAITDALAWLIQTRMNQQQRTVLMQELFGKPPGLGFSFTRLTIGASDFSRTHYSFDDVAPGQTDPALSHFSIEPNRAEVLPTVKAALAINPNLRVMASPWSAPAWMKTSDNLIKGSLKPEAYGAFAEYLKRYVEAYQAEGVPIFALTLQNEPHFEPKNYPGMRVEPGSRARFIGGYLGPLFEQYKIRTKIFDWDHNWDEPESPLAVLADPLAAKYIDSVAWHCYKGDVKVQQQVHDAYPAKDTYFTECSGGGGSADWDQGLQRFVGTMIIGTTRGWAKGVLFWNLALDEEDGPHLGGCPTCRGIVTINATTGEVTRNVEYYALAHASRFVRQGARRVASTASTSATGTNIDNVVFRNADDGSLVLIVTNPAANARALSVRQGSRSFHVMLDPASVATFTWKAGSQ